MIKGTDLSHWNSKVNYPQMVDYGIRFGCLKLGQGVMAKDDMFDIHVDNFDRLFVPWDLYWFGDYRYSGIRNATELVNKAGGNFGQKHPVFDLEFYDGFGPRPDGLHMRRFALDFFGELEARTGLTGMFYSNRDVITQIMRAISPAELQEFLRRPLWLATHASYGNPSPWQKYQLNQYELDLVVPWSQGTVDLNDFNGTEVEFNQWYAIDQPPQSKTLEERVMRLEEGAIDNGWWEV
jgi:lysozyme